MSAVVEEWQWLVFPENGNTWRCPLTAVGFWTAKGWEPCDEPTPVDVLHDPAPRVPEVAVVAPAAGKTSKQAAPATEGSE